MSRKSLNKRPRGAVGSEVQTIAYLTEVLCPEIADINCSRWGVPPRLWEELVKERNRKTLRQLARDYLATLQKIFVIFLALSQEVKIVNDTRTRTFIIYFITLVRPLGNNH